MDAKVLQESVTCFTAQCLESQCLESHLNNPDLVGEDKKELAWDSLLCICSSLNLLGCRSEQQAQEMLQQQALPWAAPVKWHSTGTSWPCAEPRQPCGKELWVTGLTAQSCLVSLCSQCVAGFCCCWNCHVCGWVSTRVQLGIQARCTSGTAF